MHISFTAIEASFEFDKYALIAGVEGNEHSLVLQRNSEQNFEDSGVYIEFGGQHNGDYGCVESCCLCRRNLQVILSRQLGILEDVTGFDIKLEIDDTSYTALPAVMRYSNSN